jgi:hypothetical protein
MKNTSLGTARLIGNDLWCTDLRSVKWSQNSFRSAVARGADFRGVRGLKQADLDSLIGDVNTLLPEGNAPDTGEPFYIWSCWEEIPGDLARVLAIPRAWWANDPDAIARLRVEFVGRHRQRTGTQLAADAPYPTGHPLADREA